MSKSWKQIAAAHGRPGLILYDFVYSTETDLFAKALDCAGWQIVSKWSDGGRWVMHEPTDDCPEWADNEWPTELPEPPELHVIDGGKNDT